MEQLKKGMVFWIMLVVSVVLPSMADAQVRTKKISWAATITVNGSLVGNASITRTIRCQVVPGGCVQTSDEFRYTVRTVAYQCAHQPCEPGEIQVTQASLRGPGINDPWVRVLCDGATCTYNDDRDGDLDLRGILAEPLPSGFSVNLDAGTVEVLLNEGVLGVGTFVRTLSSVQ
jgi:hypothetical protein